MDTTRVNETPQADIRLNTNMLGALCLVLTDGLILGLHHSKGGRHRRGLTLERPLCRARVVMVPVRQRRGITKAGRNPRVRQLQ